MDKQPPNEMGIEYDAWNVIKKEIGSRDETSMHKSKPRHVAGFLGPFGAL